MRNFCQFHQYVSCEFLSCVDDYTEDMVTFTALAKIYSSEYFCNARVVEIGKIFVQRNLRFLIFTSH